MIKYIVTVNMPGCLPDNIDFYDTKTDAILGMKLELKGWEDSWKYSDENKNPYWKKIGNAKHGFFQIRIGEYSYINIEMSEIEMPENEDQE